MLCLAPLLCAAQGRVAYTYDEAGNRISRQIVVTPAAQNASRAASKTTGIGGPIASGHELRLTAWPLPAKEVLHVRTEGMSPASECMLTLFSATGGKVLAATSGKAAVTLSLAGVPKGHYVLQAETEGKTAVLKITKE